MGNQGQAETGSDKGEKVRQRGPLVSKVRGKGERGMTRAFPGELVGGEGTWGDSGRIPRAAELEFAGCGIFRSEEAL